jgi:hypothetical protein
MTNPVVRTAMAISSLTLPISRLTGKVVQQVMGLPNFTQFGEFLKKSFFILICEWEA